MSLGLVAIVLGGALVIGLVVLGVIGFRDGTWRER